MAKRSKVVFAVGLLAVIAGGALTYLTMQDGGEQASPSRRAPALYASRQIAQGTTGAQAVGQGLVSSKPSDANTPPGALTRADELVGRTAAMSIAPGEVLTAETFPPAQTRVGLYIPEGRIALALEMAHASGVAGFAGAGDRLDIFALAESASAAPGAAGPGARLIFQGVEILNVNGLPMAPIQGQPGGPNLLFLLAVTPAQAERLVYLTTFEQLYFSLVPKNQPPVSATPGSSAGDALKLP